MCCIISISAPTEPAAPCYENCINSGVSGWNCMSRCNGAIDGIDDNTNGDQNNEFGNTFLISSIIVQITDEHLISLDTLFSIS